MKFLSSAELKRRQKELRDKIIKEECIQITNLSNKINNDLEKISRSNSDTCYLIYNSDDLKDYSNITIEEVFYALREEPVPNYCTEFKRDSDNRIISVRIQW